MATENSTAKLDRVSGWVTLAATRGSMSWSRLRRVFEDVTDDGEDLGPLALRVPLWRYASLRSRYLKSANELDIDVAEDGQLANSIDQLTTGLRSYSSAIAAPIIGVKQVREMLDASPFERTLTAAQTANVTKLLRLGSAASFSVPGAGKTTEALATFFASGYEERHLLVVAPKNAFAVWEEELLKSAPSLDFRFVRLTGGEQQIALKLSQGPKAMIIGYQQLVVVAGLVAEFIATNPTFMILDESHRIKLGNDGAIGAAALTLAHLPERKLILSGTPMPNSFGDLIPQLRFLFPELEPRDDTVVDLFRPLYVRTTKGQLNVPPIARVIVQLPMTEAQRQLYTLVCSEIARDAERALKFRDRVMLRAVGQSVIRLLQLCSNPGLLDPIMSTAQSSLLREVLAEADSPKVDYVCQRARELAADGRKVVIWSTFVANVELVAERLVDLGAVYIHGRVEAGSDEEEDTREARLKRFRDDPTCFALVANPAACAEGISLHQHCHDALFLDRNFNAAQYLQAEDRIHRFGLPPDTKTRVEILQCLDSIDEIVDVRLRDKVRRMAEALEDKDLHIDPISFDVDDSGVNDEDIEMVAHHIVDEARTL